MLFTVIVTKILSFSSIGDEADDDLYDDCDDEFVAVSDAIISPSAETTAFGANFALLLLTIDETCNFESSLFDSILFKLPPLLQPEDVEI